MNSKRIPKSKHAGNFKVQSPIPPKQAAQLIVPSAIARPLQVSAAEGKSRAFACISGGLDYVDAPNLQTGK